MEIVGRGFVARNHAPIAGRHPNVTMLAAGVSSTAVSSPVEFRRERGLVAEVLGRCRRQGRLVVFFSTASSAMYGNTAEPVTEDEPCCPPTPFGRHKLALERMVAESGARWLVVRLSHAVGRWQRPHQLFPSMVRLVRSGEVSLYRDNHRDLIDAGEAVALVDALLTAGVNGEVVNVATGVPQPISGLVLAIEAVLGVCATKTAIAAEPVKTLVSVAKLRKLVPGSGTREYDEDYLQDLVRKYAARY